MVFGGVFPILIFLNKLQCARASAGADPEIKKKTQCQGLLVVMVVVVVEGKSFQIKAHISTKIASQIALNTNTRPLPAGYSHCHGGLSGKRDRFCQDIDKADMKNYKQCNVGF